LEKPFAAYTGDEPYIFVCYAHDDQGVVYPEIRWLHEQGANLWYDEGISAGKNWRAAIGDSLLGASHILFYISKRSLTSDHCNREINLALDEGKDIVPIYLEDVELTSDLKVGLSRVQALHQEQDANYQLHLLSALGQSTSTIDAQKVIKTKDIDSLDIRKRSYRISPLSLTVIGLTVAAIFYFALGNYVFGQAPSRGETISIVVVPFANISEPGNAAFATGISLKTLAYLSNGGWTVIPGNDDSAIRTADYILTGDVQQSETVAQASVRLSDSEDNTIWAQTYQFEFDDIFRLQERASRNISNATSWAIAKVEAAISQEKPLAERNVQDLYLLSRVTIGRGLMSPSLLAEARTFLELAVELDGNHVLSLSQLTNVLLSESIVGSATSVDDNIKRAVELSEKAVQLDDKSETANFNHGRALWFSGNLEQAILHLQRFAMESNTAVSRQLLAVYQLSNNELDAASTNFQRALDLGLNPSSSRYFYGLMAISERNFETANEYMSYGEEWPSTDGYVHTITVLVMLGREQEAMETYSRMLAQFPDESMKAKMDIYRNTYPFNIDIITSSLRTAGWDGES
jgi:TolB-like protein